MNADIKILRLGDMIFHRQGSFVRRFVVAVFSIALRLFFRRIETVNVETVPKKGALIFVINHPNGLIDPALVFVALPRKISFLAKSTLFRLPVISFLLKIVEALPLYRRVDEGEDISKNHKTFEICHQLLQEGGAIALFPEGVSHNSPKLLPMKTGAARIALGAISVNPEEKPIDLKIVPVGLFYTSKTTFRSEALLHFGEPFPVLPVSLDENDQPPREAVKDLTEKIETALREVTVNAESEAELEIANQAEKLFSSVSEGINLEQSLAERFVFLKQYFSDNSAENETNEEIKKRVSAYEAKLREFNIEAENLSLSKHSFWFVFWHFLARMYLILLFLPVIIIGTILHFPAYQLCKILAYFYTKHGVDDIVSTVKILAAMLFMPLTWIVLAVALYFVWNWQIALLSIPFSILSGYVALRSLEELEDLRGWFRAVRLFYLKRETFLQLLIERRALHQALKGKK
ncbi:MAG TPA: lysophospholipid acyltransferase family protein [Pyrinomonadaceae bacterium]|nr:lysophospholipid acyltransferase family protein [Pyrinomonadaceae bacterium]